MPPKRSKSFVEGKRISLLTDTLLSWSVFSGIVLDTPHNFEDSSDGYACQIVVSWPYRPGFLGEKEPLEVPPSQTERIALMKRLTATWTEPFRSLVHNIPNDNEAVCINLEDWIPERGAHGNGRIALVGDAAHSMTMCKSLAPCFCVFYPPIEVLESSTRHPVDEERRELPWIYFEMS